MSEEIKILLFVALAVLIIGGLMRSSWRMLRQSEEMLKDVDKNKLRKLDKDGWDD